MGLLLALLACAGVALALAAARTDSDTPPDPGNYRTDTEAILEPDGDAAVYRVRVWTTGEWQVFLDLDGGQVTQPLVSRPEPGGHRWRAELVVVVTLRPHPDEGRRGREVELESRLARAGGGGVTFTDAVAAGTKLADVVEAAAGTVVRPLGERVEVARLNGKAVAVWAAEPR